MKTKEKLVVLWMLGVLAAYLVFEAINMLSYAGVIG